MSDNWKILRGGGEAPQKDTAPIEENAGREEEHVDRYGDPVNDSPTVSPAKKREDWPTEAVPTAEQSVPKKHFVIGLCVLVLVFFGWIFRQEVRGVFSWAMAKVQGHDVPLSSKAPGLGDAFRFGKEYTMEEFLTVCTDGTVASVAKILEKQPALLEPKDGTTILHLVSARSINPEIFGLILKRVGRDAVNAKDSQGRTPLHIAAVSPVPAGFILAFRGNGANVIVHDNEGKTPVDAFFDSPLSKPAKITREEAALFNSYGHTMSIPFSRDRNGNPRTEFIPLANQVPEVEGKRYFTQLAHARSVGKDAGMPSGLFAGGDMVGPKRREMPSYEIERAKMRGTYRDPLPPLWKSVKVAPDTGTALARLKCLLPMAYPSSLNFFSARMAGDVKTPIYITEWNAWDVPADVRMAIMMEYLRQRLQKVRPQSKSSPNTFTFGGQANFGIDATRTIRERGDDPTARNPLVMTWMLMEYGPAMKAKDKPALLTGTEVVMIKEGVSPKDTAAGNELANLHLLRELLPRDVWLKAGMHLVAAAYVADKRRDAQWGAGFMPKYYRNNGGISAIRLWACEGRKDLSEPLRGVLAETGKVSPQLAKAMVSLVLRSGPQSTAKDESGKTPVEYAKKMGVSPAIITLLGKMPVYEPSEPPDKSPEKSPGEQPKEEKPATEKQKKSSQAPSGNRQPLGTVKNSTI